MKINYIVKKSLDLDITRLVDILVLSYPFTKSSVDIIEYWSNNYDRILINYFCNDINPDEFFNSEYYSEVISAIEIELKSRGYDN